MIKDNVTKPTAGLAKKKITFRHDYEALVVDDLDLDLPSVLADGTAATGAAGDSWRWRRRSSRA
jgi:hypothetical protein